MSEETLYKMIENPAEVILHSYGLNIITIIRGRAEVIPLNFLEWNEERELDEDCYEIFRYISLREIAEQLGVNARLVIIVETPNNGIIYRYGNHGAVWEIIGRTCGYA